MPDTEKTVEAADRAIRVAAPERSDMRDMVPDPAPKQEEERPMAFFRGTGKEAESHHFGEVDHVTPITPGQRIMTSEKFGNLESLQQEFIEADALAGRLPAAEAAALRMDVSLARQALMQGEMPSRKVLADIIAAVDKAAEEEKKEAMAKLTGAMGGLVALAAAGSLLNPPNLDNTISQGWSKEGATLRGGIAEQVNVAMAAFGNPAPGWNWGMTAAGANEPRDPGSIPDYGDDRYKGIV